MKIYDVTFPISFETPIYEGDPKAKIEIANSLVKGDAANVSHICCGVHTATHVDAPNHFIEGKRKVHELELEKLIGDCRVIELNENVLAIEPKHLENLENVERILFKTRIRLLERAEKCFRKDFTYITPNGEVLSRKNIKLWSWLSFLEIRWMILQRYPFAEKKL